ncbi:MAG: hypothetical protein JO359_01380 [Candidatus Eremiobacteraeota bacterium]|nr:hypothetical protein [Candidatus Eremiobacteraeota bacterium]
MRHLVEIESRRYAEAPAGRALELGDAELARVVAAAIAEPDLTEQRILEVRVPELEPR